MIAAQRRRELLEYKHQLGLPSSPTPFDHHRLKQRQTGAPLRYPQPNKSNTAIYDDPEFWKLSEEDQHLLEGMNWREQERTGFGPYDQGVGGLGKGVEKGKSKGLGGGGLSALEELQMAELGDHGHEVDEYGRRTGKPLYDPTKLPGFYSRKIPQLRISPFSLSADLSSRRRTVTTDQPPPGLTILHVLGPLETSVPTSLPPTDAHLTLEQRKFVEQELALDRAFVTSDLIEGAIRNEANCLLGVRTELVPLEDGTVSSLFSSTLGGRRLTLYALSLSPPAH
jgi:hypothetical protein